VGIPEGCCANPLPENPTAVPSRIASVRGSSRESERRREREGSRKRVRRKAATVTASQFLSCRLPPGETAWVFLRTRRSGSTLSLQKNGRNLARKATSAWVVTLTAGRGKAMSDNKDHGVEHSGPKGGNPGAGRSGAGRRDLEDAGERPGAYQSFSARGCQHDSGFDHGQVNRVRVCNAGRRLQSKCRELSARVPNGPIAQLVRAADS